MRIQLTFALLLLYFSAISQEEKTFHPVITIRSNPLSFLEADAGATLGIGYQFHPRWSVGIDPMLIFYSPYKFSAESSDEKEPIHGYKIRAEVKHYFRDFMFGQRRGFRGNAFIGLEFHYKHVTTKKWDTFGINCLNGQCDFNQRAPYDENKTETGVAVKAGFVHRLWSPRWSLELYTGLGVKVKHMSKSNPPTGGTFPDDTGGDFGNLQQNGAYPIVPTGIKIVYRIF